MVIMTRLLTMVLLMAVSAASLAPAQGGDEEAMLLDASSEGDIDALRRLLRAGEDIEVRDGARRTPLLLAVRANQVEAARLLIEAGADINAKDAIQDTPFLYAAAEGRNEILRRMLASGRADLTATNRFGGVGLIPAAHHGHIETVRILLATDIDIDHVNNLGWTALMEAVILGDGGPTYQTIVRLLVEAGAGDIPDRDGKTPLTHARAMGYREIASILEERGQG
jgi:ankyrin repeat protein